MSDIRMQSIFLDEEFIFERSSYNRNGNREGSTRTKEELKKGVKNSDPRDKMRGANSKTRAIKQKYATSSNSNTSTADSVNSRFSMEKEKADGKNNTTMQRNLDGSQKHVNASRSKNSWEKAAGDYKSKEKIVKHMEKQQVESALMDMIEII